MQRPAGGAAHPGGRLGLARARRVERKNLRHARPRARHGADASDAGPIDQSREGKKVSHF